jgi:hypothetical protein
MTIIRHSAYLRAFYSRFRLAHPTQHLTYDQWYVKKYLPWYEIHHKRTLQEKIIVAARADLGLREGPNNSIKYNTWWCAPHPNDDGAYCVRALAYWAHEAGSKDVVRGASWWENTDAMLEEAKHRRHGLKIVNTPITGDFGVIDFDGHTNPDHGLCVEAVDAFYVHTIEANALLLDGTQGVGRHIRPRSECWFIRLDK